MKIYTSKNCLNCIALKQILIKNNIKFEEIDGTTTKSVAYLRARKSSLQLPIIEMNDGFFTFDQYMNKNQKQ
jgi:glutaredoxin